jgi:hypothetical protein
VKQPRSGFTRPADAGLNRYAANRTGPVEAAAVAVTRWEDTDPAGSTP